MAWNAINSMNNMKSNFAPKRSRNFGREKESTNNVKNMMKFSFGSSILESILSVFKGIIKSKNFDVFGKLSFNNFCKLRVYLQ